MQGREEIEGESRPANMQMNSRHFLDTNELHGLKIIHFVV